MSNRNIYRNFSSTADSIVMDFCGRHFDEFPFACGRKGFRYPIFCGHRQIAEMHKECKVKDDLHSFDIAVAAPDDMLAALLLACYTFHESWWRSGPATRNHTHMYIQKKTRPGCDYYDPMFFDNVSP